MKRIFKLWLPPIIWGIVIFSFSSFSTPKTSPIYWQDFLVKKTAHVIEYGILTILLYRALRGSGTIGLKAGILVITIVFFYAVSDEFHQSFTPGREPRLRDVLIDTTASAVVIFAVFNLLPKSKGKIKELSEKLEIV